MRTIIKAKYLKGCEKLKTAMPMKRNTECSRSVPIME